MIYAVMKIASWSLFVALLTSSGARAELCTQHEDRFKAFLLKYNSFGSGARATLTTVQSELGVPTLIQPPGSTSFTHLFYDLDSNCRGEVSLDARGIMWMARVTKSTTRVAFEEQVGAVRKLDSQIADLDQQMRALTEIRRALADRLSASDVLNVDVPDISIAPPSAAAVPGQSMTAMTLAALSVPPPQTQFVRQKRKSQQIANFMGRLRGSGGKNP